jgi:hypothetical protein
MYSCGSIVAWSLAVLNLFLIWYYYSDVSDFAKYREADRLTFPVVVILAIAFAWCLLWFIGFESLSVCKRFQK